MEKLRKSLDQAIAELDALKMYKAQSLEFGISDLMETAEEQIAKPVNNEAEENLKEVYQNIYNLLDKAHSEIVFALPKAIDKVVKSNKQ